MGSLIQRLKDARGLRRKLGGFGRDCNVGATVVSGAPEAVCIAAGLSLSFSLGGGVGFAGLLAFDGSV